MKNIFLCGFMGCGKTTVGQALAEKLGMTFIDMDRQIENTQGESVSDIFKNHGEAYFRALETKTAKELSLMNGVVVATGGGAVMSSENVEAFKSGGIVVLIDVPVEVIALRLHDDTTRPLLKKPDKNEVMRSLYLERMPIYRSAADFTVSNSDNRACQLIADEILEKAKGSL
jgi:shikimate kinase